MCPPLCWPQLAPARGALLPERPSARSRGQLRLGGPGGDDGGVVVDELTRESVPGAAKHLAPRGLAHPGAQRRVGRELGDANSQRVPVARGHQVAGYPVVDQVKRPAAASWIVWPNVSNGPLCTNTSMLA